MQFDRTEASDIDSMFDEAVSHPYDDALATPSLSIVAPPPLRYAPVPAAFDVFQRVGQITRKLHDALQALGYDEAIAEVVNGLPDARTRLDYVARLTGNAADRVLNSVDVLNQEQARVDQAAANLRALTTTLCPSGTAEFVLANEMLIFLDERDAAAARQRHHITEIMMAQDFHDLTGQVINKIVVLAASLEMQLVKLLVETTPPTQRSRLETSGLSGPVIDANGAADVLTDQAQVDDLLESLGF